MFIWKVEWQRSHLPSSMHWFTPPNSCNSQANAQGLFTGCLTPVAGSQVPVPSPMHVIGKWNGRLLARTQTGNLNQAA